MAGKAEFTPPAMMVVVAEHSSAMSEEETNVDCERYEVFIVCSSVGSGFARRGREQLPETTAVGQAAAFGPNH